MRKVSSSRGRGLSGKGIRGSRNSIGRSHNLNTHRYSIMRLVKRNKRFYRPGDEYLNSSNSESKLPVIIFLSILFVGFIILLIYIFTI